MQVQACVWPQFRRVTSLLTFVLTSSLLTQKEILLPSSIHLLLTNHITALIIMNASSKQLRSARLHRKQALFPTVQGKASVCYKTNQITGEGETEETLLNEALP